MRGLATVWLERLQQQKTNRGKRFIRDSRGRYSRESDGNYSNRGGNRGGGYSRDYSYRYSRDEAKKDMAAEINELMQYAENETERSVLRQAAEMLKNNAEK